MMLRATLLALWAPAVLAQFGAPVPPLELAADVSACATYLAMYSTCFNKPAFTAAPIESQAACLCCVTSSNISPVYGDCASYITSALPTATADYELNTLLSSFCSAAGTGVCKGGSGGGSTATATATSRSGTTATGSASGSQITYAAACTSLNSIWASCSRAVPSFTKLSDPQAASCLCFSKGSYTTAWDSYASDCVSYVKTANPTQFVDIEPLTTLCERNSPGATDSATDSPTPTPSKSPSKTATVTTTGANTAGFTTSTRSAPAPQVVPSGPVAWIAQALTFVLSFFFLV